VTTEPAARESTPARVRALRGAPTARASRPRVVVDDRIAEHDRVHLVAGLAEHRADQRLAGRRDTLQERRIERAFDARSAACPATGRPRVRIRRCAAVDRGRPAAAAAPRRRVRIERAHAGMTRRRAATASAVSRLRFT
jgi:hypothetical protein